ncbi:hypothetical protein NBRC116591_39140 [Sessilibacter corallicola]|uniref:Adenosine deaminase domain-containing protein n=2 Tax=Sessilibacter corallicola TaxID=2904075 RepID=A0ABQ0AEN9_9GAMM
MVFIGFMKYLTYTVCVFLFAFFSQSGAADTHSKMEAWFKNFKTTATPQQMYNFVRALPKGGDLHHHLTGSMYSEWWYELASNPASNGGYEYFTRVELLPCRGYNSDEFSPNSQFFYFKTIQKSNYETLSACEKSTYKSLSELSPKEKNGFLSSIRLDEPHEDRKEFFERHWQRLGDMTRNPIIRSKLLLRKMQSYKQQNVSYLETISNPSGFVHPDGSYIAPESVLTLFKDMLNSPEAKATGVTVRFQISILRFSGFAEKALVSAFEFIDNNRDYYVAINFVGREDDGRGHPLRFLKTLRELRLHFPKINLSIHGGESVEPNKHVKDTLLIGATRIGHGLNSIMDPDTLLLLRNGKYLIETNLISNYKLKYITDFKKHPFPEYLRVGIPVALSTDDNGMWDSTFSDEFYVAIKEYNLSWQELTEMITNSIAFSYLDDTSKEEHMTQLDKSLKKFMKARLANKKLTDVTPERSFICEYDNQLCES